MTQTAFQAVLFDLDGTLIDTEPAAATVIQESFAEWGVQLVPIDAHFITGRTWQSAFDYLFSKYTVPLPTDQAAQELLRRYRQALQDGKFGIVPGSVEAVRSLATEFPLAVVSGSHRSEILWAIERLGIRECFQAIFGAEDYPRSKPAPDGYVSAQTALSAKADRCLIFEDSQAGIASGRAAGSWVVAITGTNHFRQDISAAHEQIPDLTQVDVSWVRKLANRFL